MIKVVKLADMNPAPYNPRKDLRPGDEEYQQIEQSIDRFGMVEPIVWNEVTGNIVGGHQRYKVLTARGEVETEASVVHLEDEQDEIALNLALNNAHGKNDDRKIKEVLKRLDEERLKLTAVDYKKIIGKMQAKVADKPQIEFTEELKECHNYLVLYFENTVDWLNAQTFFKIRPVHALHSHDGFVKIGLGRVLNGAVAMKKILDWMEENGHSIEEVLGSEAGEEE